MNITTLDDITEEDKLPITNSFYSVGVVMFRFALYSWKLDLELLISILSLPSSGRWL